MVWSRPDLSLRKLPCLLYRTPGTSLHDGIVVVGVVVSYRSPGSSKPYGDLYNWREFVSTIAHNLRRAKNPSSDVRASVPRCTKFYYQYCKTGVPKTRENLFFVVLYQYWQLQTLRLRGFISEDVIPRHILISRKARPPLLLVLPR